jgi:MFS family permease
LVYPALLALGALDAAGYSIIAPVVPAIASETGAGPGVMGALVATFAVGMAAGFVLGGQGVQRRQASFVLGGSIVLMAAGCLGFILGSDLAVYFVSRLLMGIGSGGLWIGVTFATLERFPGEEYRRLAGVLAAYSVGGIAGAGLGAAGGIRGPFLLYLGLVACAAVVVRLLGKPRERATFTSDRAALRSPSFWLASAGILLVALALGTLEGPLPLHFSSLLSQREISALYVAVALVIGVSAAVAGRLAPRPTLAVSTVLMVAGIALTGAVDSVALWLAAGAVAGVGFGAGEAGALGILLESVGTDRMVLAMVVWSQLWAVGYLAGPAAGGGVVEALGFEAIGLVPLAAALLVLAAFVPLLRRAPARSGASRA